MELGRTTQGAVRPMSGEYLRCYIDWAHGFSKENDIRLNEPFASLLLTPRNGFPLCKIHDHIFDLPIVERCLTYDTSLRSEASMSFDNLVRRHSGAPFQSVNILCEAHAQKRVFR